MDEEVEWGASFRSQVRECQDYAAFDVEHCQISRLKDSVAGVQQISSDFAARE